VTDEPDLGDVAAPPPPEVSWQARVLCAVQALEAIDQPATPTRLKEMVGAKFASAFLPGDRLYEGARPSWEARVVEATAALVTRKLLRRRKGRTGTESAGQDVVATTAAGRKEAEAACALGERVAEDTTPTTERVSSAGPVMAGVVTPPLQDRLPPTGVDTSSVEFVGPSHSIRLRPGVRAVGSIVADALDQADTDEPEPVMIELNLQYGVGSQPAQAIGVAGAVTRVHELWKLVGAQGEPVVVAEQYMSGDLTKRQVQNIATADSAAGDWPKRAIFRIWPDFEVRRQIDASCTTVKAVPAQRSFAAFGDGIVWAVIDSGIDKSHPHFLGDHTLDDPSVADLHRDFVSGSDDPAQALIDDDGHGTHVAGIIAGGLQRWNRDDPKRHALAVEKRKNNGAVGGADPILAPRPVDIELLNGVAPLAKLVSLKVLSEFGDLTARTARVMAALAYVRQKNADGGKLARIHGVNLSLGYGFLADWFGCGQSPLCLEVNRLVLSGVVVVVAAGNSGYVTLNESQSDVTQFSAAITINDPGNAERAITVGSTHRDSPHTNGISYFSSRGPTGDGRPKPDLVAPGERITSAAGGQNLKNIQRAQFPDYDGAAVYIEDSGTSMSAPHVSGAIAAFLSVQREYLGKPDDIKQIFTSSATSLNRDPNFQGAGMVDLMRALQTP
jgi:subtilisin family serine protease